MRPWNLLLPVWVTPRGRPLLPLFFLAGGPSAAVPAAVAAVMAHARGRRASGHMSGAVCAVISSVEGSVRGKRACDTQLASSLVTAT